MFRLRKCLFDIRQSSQNSKIFLKEVNSKSNGLVHFSKHQSLSGICYRINRTINFFDASFSAENFPKHICEKKLKYLEKKSFCSQKKILKWYSGRSLFSSSHILMARKKKYENDSTSSDSEGRAAALEAAIKHVQNQYGKTSVMKLGSSIKDTSAEIISTGSIGLDFALGVGGLPKGRVIEIYGPEASGKTTLALHVIAEAQKKGGACVFIDAEHALNPEYARGLGVDTKELYISQPDHGEQALEIADTLIRSGGVDVIVIDSVAALVPRAEVEGDMGDPHMALQARLMSQALRKLTHNLSKANTMLIFINQIRHKVGVMFGSPEVTAGGNALKFYCSVRLDIRKIGSIKQGEEIIGNRVRVKVVKNKLASPFQSTEFDLLFGKGISKEGELIDVAVKHDIITKSGAWFSFGDRQLGQGREKTKALLENDKELKQEIESKLVESLKKDIEIEDDDIDNVYEDEE